MSCHNLSVTRCNLLRFIISQTNLKNKLNLMHSLITGVNWSLCLNLNDILVNYLKTKLVADWIELNPDLGLNFDWAILRKEYRWIQTIPFLTGFMFAVVFLLRGDLSLQPQIFWSFFQFFLQDSPRRPLWPACCSLVSISSPMSSKKPDPFIEQIDLSWNWITHRGILFLD